MDLYEVSSKVNSDFSIERILSEDSRNPDPAACDEPPSWLCCTRYKPPKLNRPASNATTCRPRRSGRHARVPFTAAQASALEAAYSRSQYLAPPALRALAAALQLRDDRIKIWFQNRRARARREKCTAITPPGAITLPPTTLSAASSPTSHHTAWLTCSPCTVTSSPGATYISPSLPNLWGVVQDLSKKNSMPVVRCSSFSESSTEESELRPDTPLDVENID